MRFLVLLVALAPVASALPACSSSGGSGGSCKAYVVPSSFDATSPVVSFKNDVWPLFQPSCALSTSCHGAETGSNQASLYLGKNVAQVYDALVNKSANKYPSMLRVKPSDTQGSFLMHKLDDDACTLSGCTTSDSCANSMPSDEPPDQAQLLDTGSRDTIRRWILQGAPNN